MQTNLDIYLIGFSVLIFLIIAFLFVRKISNAGELKVKIEPVTAVSYTHLRAHET